MRYAILGLAASLVCLNAAAALAGDWRDDRNFSAQDREQARHLYSSGSECGPDQATPVWGHNNVLLGYSCEPASANGS